MAHRSIQVEMFKIRMQGQFGGKDDKKLGAVVRDMWRNYGFRDGIMRGYWVTVVREIPAYAGFYAGAYLPHNVCKRNRTLRLLETALKV